MLHGNQAARIGSRITVELNDLATRSLSSCTIVSPAQSSQRPSVAQRAARAGAGTRSVIESNEKKLLYFQSTMFTEFLPGAKVLDKISVI